MGSSPRPSCNGFLIRITYKSLLRSPIRPTCSHPAKRIPECHNIEVDSSSIAYNRLAPVSMLCNGFGNAVVRRQWLAWDWGTSGHGLFYVDTFPDFLFLAA